MGDSMNLGHDPRHFNEDSVRAHRRIRLHGIAFLAVVIVIIALIVFFSCCFVAAQGPVFEFNSTSQFLLITNEDGGVGIEEFHRSIDVCATWEMIVIPVAVESQAPLVFDVMKWYFVNDSTYIAYGRLHGHDTSIPSIKAEWQRRMGEEALRIDFMDDHRRPACLQMYQFYRDKSLISF